MAETDFVRSMFGSPSMWEAEAPPKRWGKRAKDRLALRRAAKVREGDDDHFYGPWKGGAKGSGGRPAPAGRRLLTSADVGPDDSRVGDAGVTEKDPYPSDPGGGDLQPILTRGDADGTGIPYRKRLGRCYELSGRYLLDNPNTNLVHGSIQGMGQPRIKHAWVETLGTDGRLTGIFEPISNAIQHPGAYGLFFNAHVDKRYPQKEALAHMVKKRHFGPW
jgi:hypothetical protein